MNKKSAKPKGQFIALLIYLLVGIAIAFMFSGKNMTGTHKIVRFVVLFACTYISMYLHLIIHEAGHLVFGLLSGYKFCSFRVASFMLIRSNGKFSFKRLSLAGTGGQCLMSPPDMKDGRFPYALYNFGGSIMNMIFVALACVLYFVLRNGTIASACLILFIDLGLCIGLTNGIPLRMPNLDNDGQNAISLGKDAVALKAFWTQLKINELTGNGVRLKDMPAEWFELPDDARMDNCIISTMGSFACNRLFDEGRYEEADDLIARMLDGKVELMGIHRALLTCDRIWCRLMKDIEPEKVNEMLDAGQKKFMKAMKKFPSVIRTEYALALLFENDADRAQSLLNDFEKIAKSYPYKPDIEGERTLINMAKKKYEERCNLSDKNPCI